MGDAVLRHLLGEEAVARGLALGDALRAFGAAGPVRLTGALAHVRVYEHEIGGWADGWTSPTWAAEPRALQGQVVDEAVRRALAMRIKTGYRVKHVLAQGHAFSARAVQCRCPNAAVDFLRDPEWLPVLEALGPEKMLELLLCRTLLLRQGVAQVQLTGPMLSAAFREVGTDMLAKRGPATERVERPRALYAPMFTRHCGLPASHPLNTHKSGRKLAGTIFRAKRTPRSQLRWQRLWATQLLERHRRCPYGALLNRLCPVPRKSESARPDEAIEHRLAPSQVASFLKAAALRVLPRTTFAGGAGARKTRRRVLEALEALVRMPKNESPLVEEMTATVGLGRDLVRWLMCDFAVPLLRAMLYCTEGSGTGQQVLYYRKPVWRQICNQELAELTRGPDALLQPAAKGTGGPPSWAAPSKLRFVPKASGGLRPVANCKEVNFKLNFVHQAAKAAFRNPVARPPGTRRQIMGLSEFFGQYRDFVLRSRAAAAQWPPQQPFSVLTADVHRCFDNMDQHKACGVVNALLHQSEYVLRGYSSVFANRAAKRARAVTRRVVELRASAAEAARVGQPAEPDDVFERARVSKRRCIFIDRAEAIKVSRSEVSRKLSQHLCEGFTSFDGRLFKQVRGVPQGSVLSALVSAAYFENFERVHLEPVLAGPHGAAPAFCARLLDDYLVVAPDQARVDAAEAVLLRGDKAYGFSINPDKTRRAAPQSPRVPWCGLLFDARDLSVSFDLSRLDLAPRARRLAASPNHQLRQALQLLALRCYPILLDAAVNPPAVARENARVLLRLALLKLDAHNRATMGNRLARFLHSLARSRCGAESLSLADLACILRRERARLQSAA